MKSTLICRGRVLSLNGQQARGLGPLSSNWARSNASSAPWPCIWGVAWRIAYLMRMGRTCPHLDAKLFFDPGGIQAAYLLNKQLAPPAPKLNKVLRMVARVGGFLARKDDGEPGTKTIWEGLRDVRSSAHTLKALREMGLLSR